MPHPNLMYIFADQMRAQATGYAGDPNVSTPYLDHLAGESMNCTTAVSTCPICTPYRACLLTGQYPLTHGLFMNDLCLPDNGQSFGQVLQRSGYDTAWIGKWHLDGHGRSGYIPPERRQGFSYWKTLECTHEYLRSQYYAGDSRTPMFWNGYDVDAQTDDAVNYIRERQYTTNPFALFLSFGTPHDPYDSAPEALQACYREDAIILRGNVPASHATAACHHLRGYYAHITAIDQCLERLDQALVTTGLQDDTIVVFTADHGDMVESHATTLGSPRKQVPYDESILVPFLLRYPAQYGRQGKTITTPIATPDIMPTLLAMSGLEIPNTVEGINVLPTLADIGPLARTGVLIANYHPFADWRTACGGRPYRGIRTARYSFVRDRNGPWLLFDNAEDPYQLRNLVNSHALRHVQAELEAELSLILQAQGDHFEQPETLRQRWGYTVNDWEEIPYV